MLSTVYTNQHTNRILQHYKQNITEEVLINEALWELQTREVPSVIKNNQIVINFA